jgi:hypothetical protein
MSAAVPQLDEDEITSIVTKRLWSNDMVEIFEPLKKLAQLLANTDNNRVIAFRRGAVMASVQTMYRYEACAAIQCDELDALVGLSCCVITYFQWDIIQGRGIECCIWSMGKHKDQPTVQASGCLVIANLFLSPSLRKSIVDDEGLKLVVYAMGNNQDDATVQQNGCRAFANLLLIESSWAKAAADYGGIRRVMSAMNNHPFHAEIQKNGCYFLAHLSSAHQEYRSKVIEANGAASIAEALRIHIGNEQVMSAVRQALTAMTGA